MNNRPGEANPQLSDDQLRTLAYFSIGVASEGSSAGRNVAYQLSFAGNVRAGVMEPIGNSGFSIGTLQTDLGQHPAVAADLIEAYQDWARQQTPSLELDARQRAQTVSDLQRDGNAIRAQNGRSLDATVKSNLDTFLGSDEGVNFVHARDVAQVDRLLRTGDGRSDNGGAMQQLRSTELYQRSTLDDQAKLATMMMKLENQAGQGRYPGVIRSISSGDLDSVDDVKARIDGMLPNRIVRGTEQADYLESGVEHALQGTEVFNRLRAAGQENPMREVFSAVSANPLANPATLAADRAHPDPMHRYETVKTLFLQNIESPAYLDALEAGRSHAWGRPQPEGRASATAGLYASGGDLVVWNRDGHGHSMVDGQWSAVPRSELTRQRNADGTVDLDRTLRDGTVERVLHVDPNERARHPNMAPPEQPGQVDQRHGSYNNNPLLDQANSAVARLEESLGRSIDDSSRRLAASAACLAAERGMERIDHVILSSQTSHSRAGEHVFVIQGDLADPAHLRAHMSTSQAVSASVEESLTRLQVTTDDRQQANSRSQTDELIQQQGTAPPSLRMT
ncbi:XVIPCD domain-containing protein [Stenotrophomonas sp. PS02289]|uniref:XVIPCD domain-containing protein n=1 Tax=Stenotrophomonas sp. PS02289 TaxID=2991422 RepID=UPI00249C91DE|nr:XVIPCD domain-containing protein [Stenotrophomonas sp. PS02289]